MHQMQLLWRIRDGRGDRSRAMKAVDAFPCRTIATFTAEDCGWISARDTLEERGATMPLNRCPWGLILRRSGRLGNGKVPAWHALFRN